MTLLQCTCDIITVYIIMIQDGGASKPGTISAEKVKGCNNWIRVKWDSGCCDNYRMGAENYYDLQLAGNDFPDNSCIMYVRMYVHT